jgi:hypothetical protein
MVFMEDVLDENIREAVLDTGREPGARGRILYVSPPPFTLGLGPGEFACGPGPFFNVDGPSHQPTITQRQMRIAHPFGFCGLGSLHPVAGQRQPVDAQPWALSSDTGIHPNVLGYEQMANAVVEAVGGKPWAPPRTVCPGRRRIVFDGECEPIPDPPADGEFSEPPRFWRATSEKTDLFVEANRWNTFGSLLAAKQLNNFEDSNSMRWQDLIVSNLGVGWNRGRAVFPIEDSPSPPVEPLRAPVYDFGRLKVGCTQPGYVLAGLRVFFTSALHPDGWFYPTDTDAPYRTLELGIAIKKPWFTGLLPKRLTVRARVKCEYYPQLADQ